MANHAHRRIKAGIIGWTENLTKIKVALNGIAEAQRLKMPYDEGIAHYHLGQFLPADDPWRAKHLNQAVAIFERLGAKWDWEQA